MGDLRKYRNKPVDCLVKSASGRERSQCEGPEVCLGNSKKASVAGMECMIRQRVGDEVQRKEGPGALGPGGHWKYFGFYSELCKRTNQGYLIFTGSVQFRELPRSHGNWLGPV